MISAIASAALATEARTANVQGTTPSSESTASAMIQATGYTGDVIDHNDIAVLRLDSLAPAQANSYGLYTNNNLTFSDFTVHGYGLLGDGANGTTNFAARLRNGDNRYDFRMGDAAFGMTGLDFETAVRCGIPITTVVLNNSSMAVEHHALVVSHERYRTRDIGGNYADMGRAMGGYAERIEQLGDELDVARDVLHLLGDDALAGVGELGGGRVAATLVDPGLAHAAFPPPV